MDFYGILESIECESAHVMAKFIEASQPLHHPLFGRCLKYVCKRDGETYITKELSPKKSLVKDPISNLNLGDKLIAESFYVLAKGFRPQKLKKVPFSGAHNSQEFSTSDYTYCEISKPYSKGLKKQIILPPLYVSPLKQLTKKEEK